MPPLTPTSHAAESGPSLPRPTVVNGSRLSSRFSSRAASATSSILSSRSTSPARRSQSIHDRDTAPSAGPLSSRSNARSSQGAAASSSSSINIGSRSGSAEQARTRSAMNANNVVEISSDSSDEEQDFVVAWASGAPINPPPTDYFEVSAIRRAQPPAGLTRTDLFSPPPSDGRVTEPIGRMVGISADPGTGDFLTRPMPIVRPSRAASQIVADHSFSIVSAQVAPQRQRSEHPITDQRLRSSNLAMPTKSPPRTKAPPIEHPLLSKYACPICFDAPTDLVITPCGHFFCGECLFQALKTQAVQRGIQEEEEESFFNFGSIFSPFAPAGTFGSGRGRAPFHAAHPADDGEAGRGEAAAAASRTGRGRGGGNGGGRGGSAGGGRGRNNKPDPLAGQCPVCRSKIKGAFNGREKTGIMGLRLTMGKPINDPRQADGQMKKDLIAQDADGSSDDNESEGDQVVLPTSKGPLGEVSKSDQSDMNESLRTAREPPTMDQAPDLSAEENRTRKRPRDSSDSSATQVE